jgi:hypothetical protein
MDVISPCFMVSIHGVEDDLAVFSLFGVGDDVCLWGAKVFGLGGDGLTDHLVTAPKYISSEGGLADNLEDPDELTILLFVS